jgi:hypothetical protein
MDMGPVEIILIAAAVIYVIGKRLAGEPLQARRLLVVPVVMMLIGVGQLHGLDPRGIAVLVLEVLLGIGFGALRGATIKLYEQGGHLWYRYRPVTLLVWLGTIVIRVAMVFGAQAIGVNLPTTASLLITFGISLLGEAAVVAARAQRMGVPYAPDRRTARATATLDTADSAEESTSSAGRRDR